MRMPYSLLFSVDLRLHTLFTCCSTISARIVRADYPRPLRRFSVVSARIICVGPRGYLQLSARNNHGNLRKKLSFPCHVPYMHRNIRTYPLIFCSTCVHTCVHIYSIYVHLRVWCTVCYQVCAHMHVPICACLHLLTTRCIHTVFLSAGLDDVWAIFMQEGPLVHSICAWNSQACQHITGIFQRDVCNIRGMEKVCLLVQRHV